MSHITTTSDFRTWWIQDRLHTTAEIKEYVDELDYDTEGHVRVLTVSVPDKVIVVNGFGYYMR